MIEKITAEQARGMMKPSERGERILERLYKSIAYAARRKKSMLFVGVHAFDSEVKWILDELARDGYEAKIFPAFLAADEFTTHVIQVKW